MEGSSMFTGRHHWNDSKLFKVTKVFISQKFGFSNPSDYETWALVLLLNPAKGITESKKKDKFKQPACEELYAALSDDGLEIFRDIFSNNNRNLIYKFFTNDIIRKLWPYVGSHLTFENCFKRSAPRDSIKMTYVHITRTLIDHFYLDPPGWWLKMFHYQPELGPTRGYPPNMIAPTVKPSEEIDVLIQSSEASPY
jgi:hypothetical protein